MTEPCPKCDGMGMVVVRQKNGRIAAEPCECNSDRRRLALLARAKIPARYQHCSFESYQTNFEGADPSLSTARFMVQRYLDGYPTTTEGRGLLLTGSIGVGKTHLSVSILQSLILEKGAKGLFYDYRELLKEIQHSYNPQVQTTELDILRPVFDAELLVLDELGASKPTEWVWDTVAHILNTRYNNKRITIITTNYADAPPGGIATGLQRAMREETLGDRIGERMRSRLAEMCVTVNMHGDDYRQRSKRARFG